MQNVFFKLEWTDPYNFSFETKHFTDLNLSTTITVLNRQSTKSCETYTMKLTLWLIHNENQRC